MNYLTDGTHLYEIAAQRTAQNFGRTRGLIRYVTISGLPRLPKAIPTIDWLNLAALTVVR